MKNKNETQLNRKKKHHTGWIIVLVIVALLGISGGIGWSYVSKEHHEVRSLTLDHVDFGALKDGVYTGEYDGMYQWRTNTVQVTVSGGLVTDIKLLSAGFKYDDMTKPDALYDKVIKKQSLQVDTISGATLTSKGYLQAIENALLQAEK